MSSVFLGPGAFRLVLASMVVISHMSSFAIGRPAVFAFFMLSGYWVLKMYDEKYRPQATTGVFYLSRILRIWLPFSVAYLLFFLMHQYWGEGLGSAYLWGLLLLGVASTNLDVLGTSWSLDIEMQFYLAVPLIWLVLQSAASWRRTAALTTGFTILGWGLLLYYGVWTFLAFLPAFAVGALIWRYQPKPRGQLAILSVALFVGIGAILYLVPGTRSLLLSTTETVWFEDWFGMVWVMLLAPFLIWNVQQKGSAFDMHMGNFSYALYITHWPIIAFTSTMLEPVSKLDKILILAVIYIFATVFYVLVDRQVERLRRTILRRRISAVG